MDPFDSFVVFSIKHGMGNVNDLHELQTRSVFRGRTASLAPTAATTEANRNYGVFRSAGETLRKQSDIGRTASFRAYGVP